MASQTVETKKYMSYPWLIGMGVLFFLLGFCLYTWSWNVLSNSHCKQYPLHSVKIQMSLYYLK